MRLSRMMIMVLGMVLFSTSYAKQQPIKAFCSEAQDLRACLEQEAAKSRRKMRHALSVRKINLEMQQDEGRLDVLETKYRRFSNQLKDLCFPESNFAGTSEQLLCEIKEIEGFVKTLK